MAKLKKKEVRSAMKTMLKLYRAAQQAGASDKEAVQLIRAALGTTALVGKG